MRRTLAAATAILGLIGFSAGAFAGAGCGGGEFASPGGRDATAVGSLHTPKPHPTQTQTAQEQDKK